MVYMCVFTLLLHICHHKSTLLLRSKRSSAGRHSVCTQRIATYLTGRDVKLVWHSSPEGAIAMPAGYTSASANSERMRKTRSARVSDSKMCCGVTIPRDARCTSAQTILTMFRRLPRLLNVERHCWAEQITLPRATAGSRGS